MSKTTSQPPTLTIDDLRLYEVHLTYSTTSDSPLDERLIVGATSRQGAIAEARNASQSNPPEVRAVYKEYDADSFTHCDNWQRLKAVLRQ